MLLEDSQALLARLSDKYRVKVKTLGKYEMFEIDTTEL
jgi:hypothetical protein